MLPLRTLFRRYRAWILITAVLLLCQRMWLQNGRVERVLTVPEGYQFLRIRNSTIYLRKPVGRAIDWNRDLHYVRRPGHKRLVPMLTSVRTRTPEISPVFAMPVRGGAVREVPFGSLEAEDTEKLLTVGANTYRVEFRTTSRLPGLLPVLATGRSSGTNTGGASSPAAPPAATLPPRTVVYRMNADKCTLLLHPVPSVSPPSVPLTYPMGYIPISMYLSGAGNYLPPRVSVSGDSIYWVKVFPDERVERVGKEGNSVGAPAYRYKTAIMAARLPGGEAHALLDGLPDTTFLMSGEDGVLCWKGDTLWRLHIDRPPMRLMTGVTPAHVSEWNGRLFWTEAHGTGSPTDTTLMQANADGSAPRLLLKTPHYLGDFDLMRYGTFHASPRGHQGHLYCLLVEHNTRYFDRAGTLALYRLKTSPIPALERLCTLPQDVRRCWFDGDFLYCLALEDRLGGFSLRIDSKPSPPQNVVYRYPLPAQ